MLNLLDTPTLLRPMVFDTNLIISHVRRLEQLPTQAVIPMVVAGELEAFALKADWGYQKVTFLQAILDYYPLVDAFSQGKLRSNPLPRGMSARNIGKNDLLRQSLTKKTKSKAMKNSSLVLLIFLIGSFPITTNGQGQKNKQYSLMRSNGLVDHNAKEIWKSIGNGYILDATSDSIYLYSYTTNFCYKEKNDYLIGLLNSQARFSRSKDTISIFLSDFGEKTDQLQINNDFVKLDRLPKNTINHKAMQQLPSDSLFILFIETLTENYAFSQERKLDWSAIRQEYGKRISNKTSPEELFQIMGEIVSLTKDHHTKIIAEDGTTLQYRGTRSAETVADVFKKQTKVKQLNDYFNLFFNTNYKNISDSLLLSKGQKVANGQIEWGSLTEKVGYINFYSFTNFAKKGVSRKQ